MAATERAAIAGEHAGRAARVMQRDLDAARRRRAECLPLVERSTSRVRRPACFEQVADEAQLLALGVERAGDEHDRRAARGERPDLGAARRGLVERHDARRAGARRRLDPGDRHRLRPARRQRRVRHVDARAGARPARRAAAAASRRRRLRQRRVVVRRAGRRRAGAAAARGRRRARGASITRLMRPLTMMATFSETARGDADVLLDDQHRHLAVLGEAHQHLLDLRDDHRREALGRLVHHQQARIGEQRARDREHLLLAAGELPAAIVACARRAAGRCRRCARWSRRRLRALGDHAQVLVDGERAPQPPALRHVADAEPGDLRRVEPRQLVARPKRIVPLDARTRPMMALHSVVLPMPLRPTTASTPVVDGELDALQRVRVAVDRR